MKERKGMERNGMEWNGMEWNGKNKKTTAEKGMEREKEQNEIKIERESMKR
jgi:hypothetical protein